MILRYNLDGDAAVRSEPVLRAGPLVVHSSEPCLRLELSQGRYLLLWGTVFAATLPDGSLRRLAGAEDIRQALQDLFAGHGLEEALDRLEGHFLGLLAEPNGDAVVFADAFHRRELYYSRHGAGLLAASSLAPLLAAGKVPSFSQPALASCLSMYGSYAPKKHTIYRDILRLGIGERLRLEDGDFRLEQRPFLALPMLAYGRQELAQYAQIMREAVSVRGSEERNWIFMSSGFDSSALLALLVERYGPEGVVGVIGRMRYSKRSGVINQFELDRAAKIAAHYRVPLEVVDLDYTTAESVEFVRNVSRRLRDRHMFLNAAYNFYRLSGYVAERCGPGDAVFAGEVSDAVHNLGFAQFASILEHPDLGFREYADKMASYLFGPSFFARALKGEHASDLVYRIFRERCGNVEFVDPASLDELERKVAFLASFFHRKRRVPFTGPSGNLMLTHRGSASFEAEMTATYLAEAASSLKPENVYSVILQLYNSYHWQGATPRIMAESVQDLLGRTIALPYWDRRLHRFLSQMPEDWGRGLEIRPTKYPLKWMLEHELGFPMHLQAGPHSYLYDVNPRFSHTSEILFGSALAGHMREVLAARPYRKVLDPEYFELGFIDALVDRYVKGEEFGGEAMGCLMSLANLCLVGWSD